MGGVIQEGGQASEGGVENMCGDVYEALYHGKECPVMKEANDHGGEAGHQGGRVMASWCGVV